MTPNTCFTLRDSHNSHGPGVDGHLTRRAEERAPETHVSSHFPRLGWWWLVTAAPVKMVDDITLVLSQGLRTRPWSQEV